MIQLINPIRKFKIIDNGEIIGYELFDKKYGWIHYSVKDPTRRYSTFPNNWTKEEGLVVFIREEELI